MSAVVKPQCHWAAGNGAAQAFGQWQRRTALQGLHHRDPISEPLIVARLVGFKGDLRLAKDRSIAPEADHHRDLHPGSAARQRRSLPTTLQRAEQLIEGIDLTLVSTRQAGAARHPGHCRSEPQGSPRQHQRFTSGRTRPAPSPSCRDRQRRRPRSPPKPSSGCRPLPCRTPLRRSRCTGRSGSDRRRT